MQKEITFRVIEINHIAFFQAPGSQRGNAWQNVTMSSIVCFTRRIVWHYWQSLTGAFAFSVSVCSYQFSNVFSYVPTFDVNFFRWYTFLLTMELNSEKLNEGARAY